MNNNYQQEQPNNQEQTKPESSGLMKIVGQSLPFLPLLFEQFTGQKIPSMGGTMAEIQMVLLQIQNVLQSVVNQQQQLVQRLAQLESNATNQFTNLTNQVQSIKSI